MNRGKSGLVITRHPGQGFRLKYPDGRLYQFLLVGFAGNQAIVANGTCKFHGSRGKWFRLPLIPGQDPAECNSVSISKILSGRVEFRIVAPLKIEVLRSELVERA